MTFLKPDTFFPGKIPCGSWQDAGYEIRRCVTLDPMMWRAVDWNAHKPHPTLERAQAYCDRINAANGACIVLNVRAAVLKELIECERGSYEDELLIRSRNRPKESHVHVVAQRSSSRLIIRTREEAEDAYYAVCSGTFQSVSRACWNAANRISNALRPYALPETVRYWPRPYLKPETVK